MTKSELLDRVAEKTGVKKRDVVSVAEALFQTIAASLTRREKVQISGFGTFQPRRCEARLGRNPRTQEVVAVGPRWSLGFRPAKRLKDLVRGPASR